MMKRFTLTNGRDILLLLVVIFIVLITAAIIAWKRLNTLPEVNIPTPAMPSPNAFEYYTAAGEAVVPVPLGAYSLDLARAMEVTKPGMTLAKGPRTTAPGKPHPGGAAPPTPTLADVQALLAANAPAFAQMRRGFRYDYREPPLRSFSQTCPHYAKYRELARGMAVAAYVAGERGDWGSAMSYCLDGIQLGEEVQHGGILLGMVVGNACQSISCIHAWEAVDHLNAIQARVAAKRLERIAGREFPFAVTLQEEAWASQAGMLEIFSTRDWRKQILTLAGTKAKSINENPLQKIQASTVSMRTVLNNYTRYMSALIVEARKPYIAANKQPPLPDDPLSNLFVPVFDLAYVKKTRTETYDNLLMLMLALRAYKLEHGQYPDSLRALTPGYLKALPNDLFALKGSYKYHRRGKAYLLYSIGPDGKDDGGTPSKDGRMPKGKSTSIPGQPTISCDSKGDIVAGVNTRY